MKATRICAALLVILLTLGMSGCLISPKEYAVSGVVTDKDTGLGVEGVTITFSGGSRRLPPMPKDDGSRLV